MIFKKKDLDLDLDFLFLFLFLLFLIKLLEWHSNCYQDYQVLERRHIHQMLHQWMELVYQQHRVQNL
jgi:hypothetical protein